MIKNERQYRISKSHRDKFVERLQKIDAHGDPILALHHAAHQSQIDTLNFEISEYEALVQGRVSILSTNSLTDIPTSLIRARIARGKTQKDLAAILGVKEQQVQRWESDGFEGATFNTLKSVAEALDVQIASELLIVSGASQISSLLQRLAACGFDKQLLARILPAQSFAALTAGATSGREMWTALKELCAVFGVSLRRLLDSPMLLPFGASSPVRYKMSAQADSRKVDAFTVYAHYVAALCCKACHATGGGFSLPSKWSEFRAAITTNYGRITLASALDFVWSCGVIVIPLCYSGAFHGAVWRIGGRYVVVVKQTTGQSARWLFDLLHEVGHIVNKHVTETSAVIELEAIGQRDSDVDDEETVANEWAEDVLFNGRSDAIEKAVAKKCRGNLRLMKQAVESVAAEENMESGVLANHMAWRLSTEETDWWGTAENMQKDNESPVEVVKGRLLNHLDLSILNEFDREMFARALTTP